MCHALIIEDEFLIADYLAGLMETVGVDSSAIAGCGSAAVCAARSQPPDLIVGDVELGHGDKGPDAVAQIRNELGAIPVIFMTATPEQCAKCDYALAILDKPIRAERLLALVRPLAA